jgi:hypothetical protein
VILFYIWAFGAGCMAIATVFLSLDLLLSAIAAALRFVVIPASAFYLIVRIAGKEWASSEKCDRLERRKGAR